MKKLLLISALLFPSMLSAQVAVTSLRADRLDAPMGISPENAPVLSWIIESPAKNTVQTAYEVVVRRNGRPVWQSGKVASDNSATVKYGGELLPDSRYDWSVRVWDNHGNVSKRASSSWHTGLRHSDWQAEWITAAPTKECKPAYFRTERTLKKRIARATAYITSRGIYEAYINGRRVGDYYLTPGWTSYNTRLQYQAYDVTSLLESGRNAVGAVVSAGWYTGGMNWGDPRKRFHYGDDIALLMQINVEYADGTTDKIVTGGDWTYSDGETVFANIYDGQTMDARSADKTWATTACAPWTNRAAVAEFTKDNLIPTVNEPIVKHASLRPVKYIVTPKGEKVLDFGQNLVGWETARLRGNAGDTVRIYHAEILDPDGNFYTTNLRRAKATTTCILGGGEERFEPTMTFYGFRYIKVEGVEGDLDPDDFTAEVIYSGFAESGSFASSNETINRLQSNIEWGFHGNFVDIPTDCPQRDERLGWTGDAQVFFRTSSFLGNVDTFFRKWLADLAADQRRDGRVPRVIPDTFPASDSRTSSTGWADCATIIPWQHYMAFGDVSILERQYPSMKRWVDYMISQSADNGYLWNSGDQHYGDWLFWNKPNDPDGKSAVTSKHLVAQCFFANSADIVRRTAELLGKTDDAAYYADALRKIREAYMNEYVTPNGLVSSDTQTAYVLALNFDMLPENLRAQALDRLVANIERYGNHITTGFLGTPYICNVLTDNGRSDVAYRLLLQKTCPSWIYPITKGATTIWERWDSIRPDGSIIDGMNSFNHYSYGAIGDWLYRSAVGIRETSAGYKTIAVRPHVGGGFEWMKASTVTPYGKVAAEWHAEGDALVSLDVTIPANTTAEIFVPAPTAESVVPSDPSLRPSGFADGYARFCVGSGDYRFEVK